MIWAWVVGVPNTQPIYSLGRRWCSLYEKGCSGPALTLGRHSPLPCALHSNLLLMWVVISQVNYFHLYIYSGAPNQIIQTVFSWQCSCDQQNWFLWIAQLQKCSKSNSFTGLKDLILGGRFISLHTQNTPTSYLAFKIYVSHCKHLFILGATWAWNFSPL